MIKVHRMKMKLIHKRFIIYHEGKRLETLSMTLMQLMSISEQAVDMTQFSIKHLIEEFLLLLLPILMNLSNRKKHMMRRFIKHWNKENSPKFNGWNYNPPIEVQLFSEPTFLTFCDQVDYYLGLGMYATHCYLTVA